MKIVCGIRIQTSVCVDFFFNIGSYVKKNEAIMFDFMKLFIEVNFVSLYRRFEMVKHPSINN